MAVETLCPARAFRKGRGGRTSVRSKFGCRREARKDVAGSKTAAPSAPSFVPIGTGSPNDGTRFKSAHKAGDLGIPMTLLSGGSVNINQGSQWGNPSERVNPQFSLIHPRAAFLRIVVRGN
jgi:hypothetical protein